MATAAAPAVGSTYKSEERLCGLACSDDEARKGLARLMGGLYGGPYPIPDLSTPKSKEILSRSMEEFPPSCHSRSAFSQSASLFLSRKILPSKTPDPAGLASKFSNGGVMPECSDGFLDTIHEVLPKVFPKGWDRAYPLLCQRVVAGKASCMERSRRTGGSRAFLGEEISFNDFVDSIVTGKTIHDLDPLRRITLVERDGKKRLVTVASAWQAQLLPLHTLLYGHISKEKWLLRGDAKVKDLSEFTTKAGEIFVSGDYESATDNFNAANSIAILTEIRKTSTTVPDEIWEMAIGSLTGKVTYTGIANPVDQLTGQLMGNFLSFPLLCITNFLGVCTSLGYSRASSMPLKINGDDIIMRCTRAEAKLWADGVSRAGLTLSIGKTLVHPVFFSINSTFFSSTATRVKLVPVLRAHTIFKRCQDKSMLVDRIKAATWGWYGKKRRLITEFMMQLHRKAACSDMVTFSRGYGLKWDLKQALTTSDLIRREAVGLYSNQYLDKPRSTNETHMFGLRDKGLEEIDETRLCKECRVLSSRTVACTTARMVWGEAVVASPREKKKKKKTKIVTARGRKYRYPAELFRMTMTRCKAWFWADVEYRKYIWKWIHGKYCRAKSRAERAWVRRSELCKECNETRKRVEYVCAVRYT